MIKSSFKIGIFINSNTKEHSTNWSFPWIEYCKQNNLSYELINPFSQDIIQSMKTIDLLLWHFSGYNFQEMLFARSIIYTAKRINIKVFPDFNDAWHFDDKIAETYLLQGVSAPIPKSYMFFHPRNVLEFIDANPKYPLVAKLRNGSGSHNVKKIDNSNQLVTYSNQMFSKGFSSSPKLTYKSVSNIRSTTSWNSFVKRFKRIPEFLQTLKSSKLFPNEKQYVFLQEFIPNDGYDLKVVVVGNKLSFIGRHIRKGDFRASGGGSLFYDTSFITKNVIDIAFKTSNDLGFKCMGYDFVINNETGEAKIVEISYGFSHQALVNAGFYFNREGELFFEPLNAPYEILANLLHHEKPK